MVAQPLEAAASADGFGGRAGGGEQGQWGVGLRSVFVSLVCERTRFQRVLPETRSKELRRHTSRHRAPAGHESEDSQQPAQHHRSLAQIAKTIWETAGRAIAAPSSQLPSKTGQEAPTPPLAPGMASEFVIRASGADKAAMKHMVCRFPQAFKPDPASGVAANAPDLKRPGEAWVMGQMEDAEARPGTRGWAPPLPPPPAALLPAAAASPAFSPSR